MKRKSRMASRMAAVACCTVMAAAWANDPDDKFRKMDTNGDGAVSASEHAAGARTMFTQMDANGDGRVSGAEMDAKHAMKGDKGRAGHHGSSADKIAKMDTDGDGALSASEHDSGAQAKFTEMDADGNGSVSRQEFAAKKAEKRDAARTP